MKRRKRQIGLKINIRQQTNPKKPNPNQNLGKAKELYGCGSFSASLQDLGTPPPSSWPPSAREQPQKGVFGGDWTPRRKSSPGQQLQRQSTSHCLGWLRGPPWWRPCLHQRDSELLPSLPAAGRANWEHPSLCIIKCKVFFAGSPAFCVMPDVLHVCYTGISISHLSESEGHRIILNNARDHFAPCS